MSPLVVGLLLIVAVSMLAAVVFLAIRAAAKRVAPAPQASVARLTPEQPTPQPQVYTPDDDEPADEEPASPERRNFLIKLIAGLSGVGALLVGVPFLGFLFAPVRREQPNVWRPVGALDDFPLGQTIQVEFLDPEQLTWAGFASQTAAWLRRTGEQEFIAFSSYCTHVGCPVRWEEGAQMFMCPCHGGAFNRDGSVAAGPPPKPLTRYETRVQNGQVEILTAPVPRAQT